MTDSRELAAFIKQYSKEIEEESAAIFAGAGLSVSAGFVDWTNLLKPFADELGVDISRETDLVSLAQYYINRKGSNRHAVNRLIIENFSENLTPTENHSLIASLPIRTFWTTNYDPLIENSLRDHGRRPDVKSSVAQLATTLPRRNAIVYKMHGDYQNPQHAVITKDDYERYHKTHGAFINGLAGDLVSKTFLFLGFSFSDPNLGYVLSRIRVSYQENQREHFTIFRRRQRDPKESDQDFQQAQIKQSLLIEDLKRFNIQSILVDEYSEITEVLRRLKKHYRRRTAFLASSADSYDPWGADHVNSFLSRLGAVLIEKKYRIATGLGKGVGYPLISGVIEQIYRSQSGDLEDHTILRPFPAYIADHARRKEVWEKYRQTFIPEAGIAVFLFGNKISDGEVVIADGMIRELEIAIEQGLVPIPIGATGGASRRVFDMVASDPEKYLGDLTETVFPRLQALADPQGDLMNLVQPIIDVVAVVADELGKS